MTANVRDRQTHKRQTGRQTGQVHGQHSVVWRQESVGSWWIHPPHFLPGRFSGYTQTEVRRTLAVWRLLQHTAEHLLTSLLFRGASRRGKTLPNSSSEQPPLECKKEEQQEPKSRRMIMAVMRT